MTKKQDRTKIEAMIQDGYQHVFYVQGSKHDLDRRIIWARDKAHARKIAVGTFHMDVVNIRKI